jgi:hypothetical protein
VGPEGWFKDPASLHQQRWLSDGRLTDLVRDDGTESHDDPPERMVTTAGAEAIATPANPLPTQATDPAPPLIRSGIDPAGLRPATDMVRFGVHYWRAALAVPAVATVTLLWLGRGVEWQPAYWALVLIGVILPAMNVVTVLRQRRRSREVLQGAARRGEPDIVIPPLLAVREALGAAAVVILWAVFGLLLALR